MFQIDPSLTYIDADREQIVAIIESINSPTIGVPGHSPQATQCYVVGRRNVEGTFSIFIYLYLAEANAQVIYVHDRRAFDIETYPTVESDALTFAESMGFMVDNVNFRNLSPFQQEEVMERIPAFHPDLDVFKGGDDDGELEDGIDDEPDALDLSDAEILDDFPSERPQLAPDAVASIARLLASF